MANEDVNSSVNYWNANYSDYGTMSKNFLSMRTILNNNSAYSAFDLQGMYNAIYAFETPPPVKKCFSRTSVVLMSDLSWKWIDEIQEGDSIFTSHGPSNVTNLHITSLGYRKMYEMYDGSLSFTSDHCLWVRRNEKDYFWAMEFEDYSDEEKEFYNIVKEIDPSSVKPNKYPVFNDETQMFIGSTDRTENFAHITGWKSNKPVLTGITASDYKLYSPIVENKGLIIVNGYLVDSSSDESIQNYNFNWDDIVTEEISETINNMPDLIKDYINYRTNNPTEIP